MALTDRLNTSQQENLLTLLCHSDEHGKLVAQMVDPQLFEGDYRVIAERATDYWARYGEAPKLHTPDLVGEILDDPHNRKGKTYQRILGQVLQLLDGINAEYVLRTLRTFTRGQKLKDVVLRAAEALHAPRENTNEEVEELLAGILAARDFQFDRGVRLVDVDRMLTYMDKYPIEFELGIDPLDRRNIVPVRGTSMLFLGPKGHGKSWFLCQVAKRTLIRRRKVLLVSNEMREEPLQQRMYQSFFAVPKRDAEIETTQLRISRHGDLTGFHRSTLNFDFAFDSDNVRTELDTRLMTFGHRMFENMIIKRWPPRTLTASGLRSYLDSLEAVDGWVPDLIGVDNIGNMKTDANNHRISLGRAYEGVVGLCMERDIALVATHQVSKAAYTGTQTRSTHASEDMSMVHTSDFVLTYSATPMERRHGLARIYVENARSEGDNLTCLITQNYPLGQFALQAVLLDPHYFELRDKLEKREAGMNEDNDEREDD